MSTEKRYTVDSAKVDATTDEHIARQIAGDPDTAPELSEEDLKRAHVVVPPLAIEARKVREGTGLSQAQFAARFGFSVKTLQKWEQGTRRPDRSARILLALIAEDPTAVATMAARINDASRKGAR